MSREKFEYEAGKALNLPTNIIELARKGDGYDHAFDSMNIMQPLNGWWHWWKAGAASLQAERDQLAAELKQSQIDAGCYKKGMEASNERLFQVTAENVALNNFIAQSCCVQAGEDAAWYPAIDHSPETPVTNQLSIEESRFLTDVITAAGLLSCGKKDKELARRITDFCVAKRGSPKPAQLRNEVKV